MKRLTQVINRRKNSNSIPRAKIVSERLRALCLSFPGTSERASWGHPNFLAGKKAFVTFEYVYGRPSIAFRLDEHEIERLTGRKQFFPTPYGRGQWISVWADILFSWTFIRTLVTRSYRLVALKPKRRRMQQFPSV